MQCETLLDDFSEFQQRLSLWILIHVSKVWYNQLRLIVVSQEPATEISCTTNSLMNGEKTLQFCCLGLCWLEQA